MQAVLLQSQCTLKVVVTELAEVSVAYYLGELVAMSGIPIVGLILLIVGLRQRSRARQFFPPLPPPGPYPYGPPPGPPGPPTPPQYYPTPYPVPRPRRSGVALIVVGSLMLAFGLPGILGRAADLVPHHRDPVRSVKVGQCISQSDFRASNMAPTPQDCGVSDSLLEVVTAAGGATSPCDGSLPVVQVVRRVDGDSDRTLCPVETKAVAYPQSARLYCLQPIRN